MEGAATSEIQSTSKEESSSQLKAYLEPDRRNEGELFQQSFTLVKTPETLKRFTELFLLEIDDDMDHERVIWTGPDSFVTRFDRRALFSDRFGSWFIFTIDLVHGGPSLERSLAVSFDIYSETEAGALSTLTMLFNTTDDFYFCMTLHGAAGSSVPLPFGDDRLLETIICQNPTRLNIFSKIEFRPENCRVLATSGHATKLGFHRCKFADDGGASFAQALRQRPDEAVGPAALHFMYSLPDDFIYDWVHYSSLHLAFSWVDFSIRQGRALASAQIPKLDLSNCRFEDGGQALVDSVIAGRGPKGLIFDCLHANYQPFDTVQRSLSFITALQSNQHLELLELKCHYGHGVSCAKALAAALRQNTTLTHLGLTFFEVVDGDSWSLIFDAIAEHPALCDLYLGDLAGWELGEDLTPTLVEMARKNNILESIHFITGNYGGWVFSKLDCNKMRKRLVGIHNIQVQSRKAGIIAKALAQVNRQPSLIYMLLRPEMDTLVMASPVSRKRHRC